MKIFQTKTKALFIVAALAVGVNLYTPSGFESNLESKVQISALTKDQMTRIELTKAGEKVILEKQDGIWNVVSPYTDKADQARVMSMILSFRKGIKMDVLVDEKETDAYGTDATNGVVVEIWGANPEPDISFTAGFDAGSGSTFVRLSNDSNIYRARIGGRHRFEHAIADWRNQVLLDFEANAVAEFEIIDSEQSSFKIVSDGQGWALSPDTGWDLDIEVIESMIQSLGRMRIGIKTELDLNEPTHQINVLLKSGESKQLLVGPVTAQMALVQSSSGPAVQVASRAVLQAIQPMVAYRNKQIFSYNPRQDLDTVQFLHGGADVLLQQDLALGMWKVNRPTNIDIDLKSIFFMVNTLASLRGVKIAENIAQDPEISGRIIIGLLGGQQSELLIFDLEEKGTVLVRNSDDTGYFWIKKEDASKLFEGFGRMLSNEIDE